MTITDNNDCHIEEAIELVYTVGTSNLVIDQLQINPNPTNGMLFISGQHGGNEKLDLEIYNSIGQVIYNANALGDNISLEVDLSSFSAGVYFVRLKSDSSTSVAKSIVKL